MYDKQLGIKVVIKPLNSNNQCAEFVGPKAFGNPITTSSLELVRGWFIESTPGERFSVTIAFKEEFDFQSTRTVKISRQVDDQQLVSTFHDTERIRGQQVTWVEGHGYTFKETSFKNHEVDGLLREPSEWDQLVASTGTIKVSIRLGDGDGVRFTPVQPAIRCIFRYGSKDILQDMGIIYSNSPAPASRSVSRDPRLQGRLDLSEYRALRQAEENKRGLASRQSLQNTPPPSPNTPRPATRPPVVDSSNMAFPGTPLPPPASAKASHPRPLEQQMGIRTPPGKKRKTSGFTSNLGFPSSARSQYGVVANLSMVKTGESSPEPVRVPPTPLSGTLRAPVAPILLVPKLSVQSTTRSVPLKDEKVKCHRCNWNPADAVKEDGEILEACISCQRKDVAWAEQKKEKEGGKPLAKDILASSADQPCKPLHKCVSQCGQWKSESEFCKDGKIFKTCASCREIDRRRRSALRQKRRLAEGRAADTPNDSLPVHSSVAGNLGGKPVDEASTAAAAVPTRAQHPSAFEQTKRALSPNTVDFQLRSQPATKTCKGRCGRIKPLDEFHRLERNTHTATYRSDWKHCNECNAEEVLYWNSVYARKRAGILSNASDAGSAAPPSTTGDRQAEVHVQSSQPNLECAPKDGGSAIDNTVPESVPEERRDSTRRGPLSEEASKIKPDPEKFEIDLTGDDIKPEFPTEPQEAKPISAKSPALAECVIQMSAEDALEYQRLEFEEELAAIRLRKHELKMKKNGKAGI